MRASSLDPGSVSRQTQSCRLRRLKKVTPGAAPRISVLSLTARDAEALRRILGDLVPQVSGLRCQVVALIPFCSDENEKAFL